MLERLTRRLTQDLGTMLVLAVLGASLPLSQHAGQALIELALRVATPTAEAGAPDMGAVHLADARAR